jgi:hypothetical protein
VSVITIYPGDEAVKDPADILVYLFDWDTENLAAAVTITTSTWTITPIGPSSTDTALTKDNESIVTGSRKTQLRLAAGTLGQTYEIANKIVTNEAPIQIKERSFRLLVEQR